MEKKIYFDFPTQVAFKESLEMTDNSHWIGGIAFHDEIICCEYGAVVDIEDVEQIVELPWVNISEEVLSKNF